MSSGIRCCYEILMCPGWHGKWESGQLSCWAKMSNLHLILSDEDRGASKLYSSRRSEFNCQTFFWNGKFIGGREES